MKRVKCIRERGERVSHLNAYTVETQNTVSHDQKHIKNCRYFRATPEVRDLLSILHTIDIRHYLFPIYYNTLATVLL